ncbi:hypothetical protein SASPL_110684 [Salvia splendens]|uniref:Uncharacterized protein n=1 Tax=Salvia splendens TaxID=180675 RepID=A0A8X9A3K3_SALSN|nr:hypothetical protein SASPL_110684 [Salvia splendens]
MAFALCNSQLLHPFPVQRRKFSTKIHSLNQNLNQEKPQFKHFASSRRFHHISTVKSASVNGYPIAKDDGVPSTASEKIELTEKLKKWVKFAREIFPGGDWWRLPTEDIGDVMVAKPVTVFRALKKMWDLIAEDRWVIFTAFVTLVITAHHCPVPPKSAPLSYAVHHCSNMQVKIFYGHKLPSSLDTCSHLVKCAALFSGLISTLLIPPFLAYACSGVRGCMFGIANMILDISFFDSETVGDLTSRLGSDCQQVSRVIGNDLNLILRNVLQGSGALIYLLVLSLPLGLCVLGICISLSTIMLIYGQYQKQSAKLTQEFTASSNNVAQETFSLMRTVRVYGTEQQELGRYESWLEKLAGINLRQSAAYGFWNFGFNTLYHATQVIAVVIGGMSILSGLRLQKLIGRIEFVDVSFHYPSRPSLSILQNFNLTVHPGEVVAIVGLSGSGKSTVVNLLLRLYEPTNGEILIDGHPMKSLNVKWLRERVGYVGQEPRLFRMDVSSNIKYGCPRAVTQQDVELAAKQAFAHDFILALPNGYQTLVDDDLLSGGQKQRIAIARAILRDPNILIMDEATSALDAESEHNVKGVLRTAKTEMQNKRTVFVIAHRLSTIQNAGRIIVMDSGKIVEMGDHTDLLMKDGLYARLIRRQADAVA